MSKDGPDHVTITQAISILKIALTTETNEVRRRNIRMAIELLENVKGSESGLAPGYAAWT